MKRLLLALLMLTALPFSVSMAEDVRVFTGATYDSEYGFTSSVGSIQHLSKGLYSIEKATIGEYGTVETALAYMFGIDNSAFSFGVLAGPNIDFVGSNGDGVAAVAYVVGAGGLVASWKPIGKKIGVHASTRYKFSLQDGNLYQDGWQGGIFVSYRFGE